MDEVTLRMSKDDAAVLRELLNDELPELEWEAARSYYRDFREKMEARNLRLRYLIGQIDEGMARSRPAGARERDVTRPDAF